MGMAQEFTRSCYALRTILSITYMYRLQTMLRLYKQDMYDSIRTCSLYTPGSDYAQEENRRVTILDLASNSIECSALQAWVETTGGMTEEDGESGWEEWIVAFKDAAMSLEWTMKEFRSLYRLQFNKLVYFQSQATQHRRHLMGTDLYPSDKNMADFYRTVCPKNLFL